MPLDSAIAWLREIRRLLRPGGFLRLSTPDLRRYVEGYLDPEGSFFAEHREVLRQIPKFRESGVPDRRGFMVNQIFRYFEHQWIYDLEEIRAAAAAAGFDPDAVTECSFQAGPPARGQQAGPGQPQRRIALRRDRPHAGLRAPVRASPPGRRLTASIQTVPTAISTRLSTCGVVSPATVCSLRRTNSTRNRSSPDSTRYSANRMPGRKRSRHRHKSHATSPIASVSYTGVGCTS